MEVNKNKETIEIWNELLKEHEAEYYELDYDFSALEPYLDFFDEIPYEPEVEEKGHGSYTYNGKKLVLDHRDTKKQAIQHFLINVITYLQTKKEKKEYQKNKNNINKKIKLLEATLDHIKSFEPKAFIFDRSFDEIEEAKEITKEYIQHTIHQLNFEGEIFKLVPPNKDGIKNELNRQKEIYYLKNSLSLKQLVDAI